MLLFLKPTEPQLRGWKPLEGRTGRNKRKLQPSSRPEPQPKRKCQPAPTVPTTTTWRKIPPTRGEGPRSKLKKGEVSSLPFVLKKSKEFPIGGRLRHFASFWRKVTLSKKNLQTILGAKPPFTSTPSQAEVPSPYPFSVKDHLEVRKTIAEAVNDRIVVAVEVSQEQFVSPLFLAKNKDGTKRPILNVKRLNEDFLPKLHFKMETLKSVLPLINKNDWFCRWDVRKGFFNIPIHPEFQHYFCFDFEGQRYQYTCLVMGLSIAPLYFSKVMGLLVQMARSWGIRVSFYIDDTLIRGPSFKAAYSDTLTVGNILQLAGFLLHEQKSVTTPTQRITYLGFEIDSRSMTVSLPQDKVKRLEKAVTKAIVDLHRQRVVTIRLAGRITGFIVSAEMATVYGKAHYRSLEEAKTEALRQQRFNFDAPFVWPNYCLQDLQWWLNITKEASISASFETKTPTTTLITDASLQGWGAIWGSKQVFGAREEGEARIDELELRTVLIALQAWPIAAQHQTILLCCDNTTAVAYVKNMGGRVPHLNKIAKQIWDILESHSSFMIAAYINTKENPADALTRGVATRKQMLDIEVQLNPQIFDEICQSGP